MLEKSDLMLPINRCFLSVKMCTYRGKRGIQSTPGAKPFFQIRVPSNIAMYHQRMLAGRLQARNGKKVIQENPEPRNHHPRPILFIDFFAA